MKYLFIEGPVVVPVGPGAVLPLRPRANQKGRLLRHLLRERPGLLRRLIARRRGGVIPVLPTVPGEEGVLPLAEESFQGSYVAVSGRPGQRTVHIVNGRQGNFAGTGKLSLLEPRLQRPDNSILHVGLEAYCITFRNNSQ